MKLTSVHCSKIIDMKNMGYSSRYIAAIIGCSKTSVNKIYNRYLEIADNMQAAITESKIDEVEQSEQFIDKPKLVYGVALDETISNQPKVLFLDLETAADISATFGRYNINLSDSNIVAQGGYLLTIAWSWNDSTEVHTMHNNMYGLLDDRNTQDQILVATLMQLLSRADVVVIHNHRFDLKVLQTRALFHGMGKIPNVKVIDTLLQARKHLRLPSNKLSSIAQFFGLSDKLKHSGIKLWIDVQDGDKDALQEMLKYNKQDVVVLKEVFSKLQSLGATGVNMQMFYPDSLHRCPACGSKHVEPTKRMVVTKGAMYDEYRCLDCKHKSRTTYKTSPKKTSLVSLH